jgi:hypothetical protein
VALVLWAAALTKAGPWPRVGERVRARGPFLCQKHIQDNEMPKENDLEGAQDQGGKHGGQAGVPKPMPRPAKTQQDEDIAKKRGPKR